MKILIPMPVTVPIPTPDSFRFISWGCGSKRRVIGIGAFLVGVDNNIFQGR